MLPALLTTLLFAVSAVAANRSTRLLGGLTANFVRITLAALFLGVWAHTVGSGVTGKAFPYFLASGCIGFGIGDLALYQALPRLGSRLSIVLVHCLAAPFAAGVEWLWLGTRLTSEQAWSSVVILAGVALALAPDRRLRLTRNTLVWGIVFGVAAACAQGLGAVVSRKAYQVAAEAGEHIDGLSAAYQRILAGWVIAAGSYVLFRKRDVILESARSDAPPPKSRWIQARGWVVLNALAGPTLGVGCYQWALADAPTGIVLPIVATTPIVIIPFARLVEGERARKRSLLGGAIAVIGAATLAGGTKLVVSWLQRSP